MWWGLERESGVVEERESVAGGRGIARNLYLGGQFVIFPYRISTQKKKKKKKIVVLIQ